MSSDGPAGRWLGGPRQGGEEVVWVALDGFGVAVGAEGRGDGGSPLRGRESVVTSQEALPAGSVVVGRKLPTHALIELVGGDGFTHG